MGEDASGAGGEGGMEPPDGDAPRLDEGIPGAVDEEIMGFCDEGAPGAGEDTPGVDGKGTPGITTGTPQVLEPSCEL